MSEPSNAAPLPADAIRIGDDQYVVPMGKDADVVRRQAITDRLPLG